MTYELHEMDCRLAMSMLMDADSIDAIVTDPPYGLSKEPDVEEVLRHWLEGDDYVHDGSGFMGKTWDSFVPGPAVWREAYRVLKPGGHLIAFFGTRTYDLGVMALRMAGFEIRDQLAWVFGSGFPKSHDVSKGIDAKILHGASNPKAVKKAIADRPGDGRLTGTLPNNGIMQSDRRGSQTNDEPATPEAAQWQGWGTALKPAYEPIVLARKPIASTVAANVLQYGTGAINIDGCRVGTESTRRDTGSAAIWNNAGRIVGGSDSGRWPANLTLTWPEDEYILSDYATPEQIKEIAQSLAELRMRNL